MSNKIVVTIPKPCHENWDAMSPVEKGKFCGACSKEVIDFSNMSDSQVAAFFKKPAGSVCGRFREEQLNHELVVPRKRIPWIKYFFHVALPALLFSYKGSAQTAKVKLNADTVVIPDRVPLMLGMVALPANKTFSGKVLDADNNPVPFATVSIKGRKSFACDADGSFKIRRREDEILMAEISSTGYETKEIALAGDSGVIHLDRMLSGDVVVVRSKKKQKKENQIPLVQKLRDSLTTNFTVYPNPASNGMVTSDISKLPFGDYVMMVEDIAGNFVQVKVVRNEKRNSMIKIDVTALAAGVYTVRFQHGKSGKVYAQKLVVQ